MAKSSSPRRSTASAKSKPATIDAAATGTRTPRQSTVPAAEHVAATAMKPVPAKVAAAETPRRETPSATTSATTSKAASTAVPPSRTTRNEGAFGRLIAAGIIGGVLGAGLLFALQTAMAPAEEEGVDPAAFAALQGDVSTLRDELAASEAAAGEGVATTEELAALDERLAAVEQSGGNDEAAAATEALRGEIEQLSAERQDLVARLGAIESAMAETGPEESIAQALAAAGLKSAIDRGGPFAPELDAYATVAPDSEAVAALQNYAAEGVPTRAALIERFPEEARAMLTAAMSGAANDGVIDRLMNSAMSVVTVRPTGEVEGDYPKAVIARMETRIADGDFESAIAEWEKLPEASRQVSEDYVTDIRSRMEADRIVAEALESASGAIAGDTN